jgi:dihydroxyacetone kinase-like predicted kinase
VGQLRAAIAATRADAVVVLPNDPNVRLAAEAARDGAASTVIVVPTRTPAEGLAAALAAEPRGDATGNADRMRDAAATVRSFVVMRTVRHATIERVEVPLGDAIALDAVDRMLASGPDPEAVALEALGRILADAELVTVFAGDLAGPDATDRLVARIRETHPDVAVEAHLGGQPGQAWLIAAE